MAQNEVNAFISAPGINQISQIDLKLPESAKVEQLVLQLQSGSLEDIHHFGREIGSQTAAFADSLLEQVRSKDLDLMGNCLSEVVTVAKSLNFGPLSDHRSKLPLIGGLIDKMRIKGAGIANKFQDVRTQIDNLINEVQAMQAGLAKRVEFLNEAFNSVKAEHALLAAHINAGEKVKQSLLQKLAMLSAQASTDPILAQEAQDIRDAGAALEKRIADFKMLQHSALQQLPMIRMVQANNRVLIEKFYTIKELTIPSWKRQFTLALSLNEQKNAVQLAHTIDNATNEFLRENARLLKENTIATAKANQRMVIDIETLQEVHQSLLSTVQEVIDINRNGSTQREQACQQLKAMREQLVQQLKLPVNSISQS